MYFCVAILFVNCCIRRCSLHIFAVQKSRQVKKPCRLQGGQKLGIHPCVHTARRNPFSKKSLQANFSDAELHASDSIPKRTDKLEFEQPPHHVRSQEGSSETIQESSSKRVRICIEHMTQMLFIVQEQRDRGKSWSTSKRRNSDSEGWFKVAFRRMVGLCDGIVFATCGTCSTK